MATKKTESKTEATKKPAAKKAPVAKKTVTKKPAAKTVAKPRAETTTAKAKPAAKQVNKTILAHPSLGRSSLKRPVPGVDGERVQTAHSWKREQERTHGTKKTVRGARKRTPSK